MPIKLKKYDIENNLDNPDDGYMILGFDEYGTLVSKDSQGVYRSVIPEADDEYINNLFVNNTATIGNREDSLSDFGVNSIAQGSDIKATGDYAFAAGTQSYAEGNYSLSRGQFISAGGNGKHFSYVHGGGFSIGNLLVSEGTNSFVHCFLDEDVDGGTLSDYSAILGGKNHYIDGNSKNSAIIGGQNNKITYGGNVVILGGENIEVIDSNNAVHVPHLFVKDDLSVGGSLTVDGESTFSGNVTIDNNNDLTVGGDLVISGTVDGVDVSQLYTDFNEHDGSGDAAHSLVNESVDGFMSTTDKDKLDDIVDNANNYSLEDDFSDNGLLRRTSVGTYDTITDSSGNWDDAYTHISTTNNPHNVGWSDVSAGHVDGQHPTASTTVTGYLTSTDWNTFNNSATATGELENMFHSEQLRKDDFVQINLHAITHNSITTVTITIIIKGSSSGHRENMIETKYQPSRRIINSFWDNDESTGASVVCHTTGRINFSSTMPSNMPVGLSVSYTVGANIIT